MKRSSDGFALITALLMLMLLLTLFGAYYTLTSIETATVRDTRGSAVGFYSAEGGLNIRAETIRQIFVGFNRPTGTSPTTTSPCTGTNNGSGDYLCRTYSFNNRTVKTYAVEDASNPVILTIPPGERYQNLSAQEYRYTVKSSSLNTQSQTEAQLDLLFKARLVPLFQFAVFYNKDLEILPGPTMTLSGPVHTNADMYLYSNSSSLTIQGQVTAAGKIYRGRKDGSVTPNCSNQQVYIYDPTSARSLIPSCPSRTLVTATIAAPFNNMVQFGVPIVTVPAPDVFDPTPGKIYWDHADLRLVLAMNASNSPVGVQVHNQDDTTNAAATTTLNACSGSISGKAVGTTTMYNYRESNNVRLLEVDLRALFDCLYNSNWFNTGKALSDTTDGGLVFHFTVKGPRSALAQSLYGMRVRNASQLQSTNAAAPRVKGLTVISDQAAYLLGNYNSTNKIPAAVMADTINELSNAWNDANASNGVGSRIASSTTYNTAFLSGTDTTGSIEGTGGQGGAYNGGVENYPRFHEDWTGMVNTYRGSFVSLGRPNHASGSWGSQSYNPPSRDWNYDTSFNNAANLPPITPRFVYLKQELFVRDFDK